LLEPNRLAVIGGPSEPEQISLPLARPQRQLNWQV
jgi:hypothetical protein